MQQSDKRSNEVLKKWVFERSSVVLYRNVFFEDAAETKEVEHDVLNFSVNGCPSNGHIYFDEPQGRAGGRVGLLSFLPGRRPFRWHWQTGCELNLCCNFLESSPAPANLRAGEDKGAILSIGDPFLLNLMTSIRKEVENHDIYSSRILEGISLQLSSMFERFQATRSVAASSANRFSVELDQILKSVDGSRNTPPLHGLARRLGLSPRHFARLFKQFAGMNYASFVSVKKAGLAQDMLAHSASPIKLVAFELGFDDAASFSRAFRQWVGCSPTVYRSRSR